MPGLVLRGVIELESLEKKISSQYLKTRTTTTTTTKGIGLNFLLSNP